jgi:hypothetical protein
LFFRIAYKLGASVSRAHGRVHQIAWRQAVYATAVIIGAWIGGSTFELQGVATAVSLALILVYLLLMHLAMKVTRVPLREVLRLHAGPLLLALIVLAVGQLAAAGMRVVGSPALATLFIVTLLGIGTAVAACRARPTLFVGSDAASATSLMAQHVAPKIPARWRRYIARAPSSSTTESRSP